VSEQVRKSDERVRLRAYHLWEQDGRPHGRNDEYWLKALRQIRDEEENAPAKPDQP
jgi:hypothetical protein